MADSRRAAAERLLPHRRRQAGQPLSRGRPHGPGSLRHQPGRRRLGRRRGHQGRRERRLVGDAPELQRHRQDRPHVGRRARRQRVATYDWDPDTHHGSGPHAVDRQERRRAGRQAHRGAQGQGRLEQHALRRPRRPRLHLRQERPLRGRERRRQPELVLRPEQAVRQHHLRPAERRPAEGHQQRGRARIRSTPTATWRTATSPRPSRPGSSTAAGPRRPRPPRR